MDKAYANFNMVLHEKYVEYNRLVAETNELRSNAAVLGSYLQQKDKNGLDADDIYSVALLEDKSEVRKKDVLVHIERASNVLQNTT